MRQGNIGLDGLHRLFSYYIHSRFLGNTITLTKTAGLQDNILLQPYSRVPLSFKSS